MAGYILPPMNGAPLTSWIGQLKSLPLPWAVMAVCTMAQFSCGLILQSASFAGPYIAQEWAVDDTMMGIVFSSVLAGLMAGYILLAPKADRIGHRRMIAWSLSAASLATLAASLMPDALSFTLLRFLSGLALGACIPSTIALAAQRSGADIRGYVVLAIYCGFSLGFAAVGFAAGGLVEEQGWRFLLQCAGLCALLTVLLVTLVRPDQRHAFSSAHHPVHIGSRVAALLQPGISNGTLLLWTAFTLNLALFYGLQSWMPTVLLDKGWTIEVIAQAAGLFALGTTLAALVAGVAMAWFGRFRGLAILCSGAVLPVAAIGMIAPRENLLLYIASVVAGIGVGGGQKGMTAAAATFYGHTNRASGLGWAMGVGRIGAIAGPLLIGVLHENGSSPSLIFVALALLLPLTAVTMLSLSHQFGDHSGSVDKPLPEKIRDVTGR
ncbi:MFS transporter [Altererythrobacter indicus]|uniref:MFS transporter n=1 Tax=Altericroceibacterium indicum TaxID=374177 RepID=A0A845A5K0_9SPHN|nr:MFS transporter [Altericroceibacterium indicum]MXP25602.1 MFS transporter [Altericroceibacterium indicum]